MPGDADPPSGPYEQMRRCLEIVGNALREAGAGFEHVVRTRVVYLRRGERTGGDARPRRGLRLDPPCLHRHRLRMLDPRWLVELEAEAVVS
jgi:enamine deaminase RidA (YjgF/YER057c/UK114 family)